jgi:hypothetical protein
MGVEGSFSRERIIAFITLIFVVLIVPPCVKVKTLLVGEYSVANSTLRFAISWYFSVQLPMFRRDVLPCILKLRISVNLIQFFIHMNFIQILFHKESFYFSFRLTWLTLEWTYTRCVLSSPWLLLQSDLFVVPVPKWRKCCLIQNQLNQLSQCF